ncbi:MAG: hypothetical protein C0596_18370 [Marinilabiliales bacterium]|nr:MAG: hypothetical protein C0596_18370 [Marinilabiliales bacterium]
MIKLEKYNLPDIEILKYNESNILVWQPDKTYAILGQRDNIESALNQENILIDNVIVMQRPSGGHSVILSPNTLVVSIISFQSSLTEIKQFFRNCNNYIINALKDQGVKNLEIKGVSDIVLNGKKIVGSSMYRGKDYLFFHAVINISEKVETIAKYLKHPDTEPDYRKGRNHLEFVTSILAQSYKINIKVLKSSLIQHYNN